MAEAPTTPSAQTVDENVAQPQPRLRLIFVALMLVLLLASRDQTIAARHTFRWWLSLPWRRLSLWLQGR